jgi:putative transposase
MCTYARQKHFSDTAIGEAVRTQLLSTAARWDVEIVAYCFMPDHLYLLVEGTSERADCRKYADTFRRTSGFQFRQERESRLWQEGYFDRVLRDEDATLDVVSYIVLNPVKAGLCTDARSYLLSGSSRDELSELLTATEWNPRSLG